ncbi:MAG TPA: hypothetical protein VFT45_05420, partial [Longimicrobium sp.]|nr:hypothetical protein [Longimicrobium sp.]
MTRARLFSCALALAACAREGPAPANTGTAAAAPAAAVRAIGADSLRGTLRITGPEPGVIFVVVDDVGRATVLDGDRALLERLAGLEVAVQGDAVPGAPFRVARVAVRAAEGVAAVDGVLAREDGRDVLVLHDGTRRIIARLPEALRRRTGARVWLAGPLHGDIDSFGVI